MTQIELIGEPPALRPDDVTPWPRWPMKLRIPYALKEGGERDFAISTAQLHRSNGHVEQIHWVAEQRRARRSSRSPGTEETRPAGLVLLAMGFLGPEPLLLDQLGVERDERGNAKAPELRDVGRRRLRRRRRAPRPVADRLGDQRRPPVRQRGRALARTNSRLNPPAIRYPPAIRRSVTWFSPVPAQNTGVGPETWPEQTWPGPVPRTRPSQT